MGIFKLSENISIKKKGENYLLFDNLNGNIYKINEVSYKILSLCNGKNTEEDIIKNITSSFSVAHEEAVKDFNVLMQNLLERLYVANV